MILAAFCICCWAVFLPLCLFGCYCFSCMWGQLILPLINTRLTPWISSRKGSAGIFIYCSFSSVMCAASSREEMKFTSRVARLNVMCCAGCSASLMCLHLCRWIHAWLISVGNSPVSTAATAPLRPEGYSRRAEPSSCDTCVPPWIPLHPLHAWMLMVFVRLLRRPGDN